MKGTDNSPLVVPSRWLCAVHERRAIVPGTSAEMQRVIYGLILLSGVLSDPRFQARCGHEVEERTTAVMQLVLDEIGVMCCWVRADALRLSRKMLRERRAYGHGMDGINRAWALFYKGIA